MTGSSIAASHFTMHHTGLDFLAPQALINQTHDIYAWDGLRYLDYSENEEGEVSLQKTQMTKILHLPECIFSTRSSAPKLTLQDNDAIEAPDGTDFTFSNLRSIFDYATLD
jgi:hypothetical protein